MKKVIALSAALGLSALGMACGGADNTNVNVNAKPANTTNVAPVSSPVTVASPANTTSGNTMSNGNSSSSNSMNSNMKPTTGNTSSSNSMNSNMKATNTTASPAATKKP